MDELREKCPWDKKQTIDTLRQLTIEEVYELADAIDTKNWKNLKEELGDILLHIFFYTKIAKENNKFSMQDVIENVCNKLVHRHPHIYSSEKVENEEQVKKNWENLKLKEGKKSILDGVPNALPAVIKALRIQEKAKQVGFEWSNTEQVMDKIKEEIAELENEVSKDDKENITKEFGDVFFSMINYARFINVDPEQALEYTNQKFIQRFKKMEEHFAVQNKDLSALSLQEMDDVWNKIKKQ